MIHEQIPEVGMEVVDMDGLPLGKVKDVAQGGKWFRVDVRRAQDYYVPFDRIRSIADDRVTLTVRKAQAPYMGWEVKPQGE